MESEKVKEIKKALKCCKDSKCIDCAYNLHDCEIGLREDMETYINELESENKRLENKNYQLEQDLGQCENGYKLELHTARYQLHSANEDLKKAQDRIAELEKENKDYYDRLNNLQTYIDNHEEIWKGNTKIQLKQFAKMLKEELKGIVGANFIDGILKEFINNKGDEER